MLTDASPYVDMAASETGYRDVFHRISDGVLIADRNGRYVDANRTALDLLGYRLDELLALSVADVVFVAGNRPDREYERFMTTGRWQGACEILRRDGSRLPVHADAKTISTPEGGIIGISVIKPVEERRLVQRIDPIAAPGPLFSIAAGSIASAILSLASALGLVAVAAGAAWVLPHQRPGIPATLFLFAIFGASLVGGIRAGMLASTAAAILLDYVFLAPRFRFGAETPSDVVLLAVFLAGALLASWIPERFQRARRQAMEERDRAAAMVTIVASLAQARSVQAVGASVVHVAAAALGAKASAVYLLSDDRQELRLVLGEGYPSSIAERWTRFSITADVPVADAARTGDAVLLGSVAERSARYAISRDRPSMGRGSLAALPMYSDDVVIGAITFNFPDDHRFQAAEVAFLRAFALHCAQAIERARLVEIEARLRERAEFLGAASAALADSLDYEKTLEQVAQLAVPRFADWAAVDVLSQDGQIELVAVAHRDPEMVRWAWELRERSPASPSDETGVGQVIRSRAAAFHPELRQAELEEQATNEEQLEIIRRLALRSVIIVPLIARDSVLGALTLIHAESARHYDPEDLRVAEDVARRAAVAIDNARLFQDRDRIARSLQEILLPASLPTVPGFELAAFYQPGSEGMDVGGDFYDVFRRSDGSFGVAIGDVCGHGPEAAAVMGVARQTIRVAGVTAARPSVILRVLNETLLRGEYERFVTVADARLRRHLDRVEVSLCLAGHPPPMILAADGSVSAVGEPGMLLGMFEDVRLADSILEMHRGDALVLYTDGLLEWPSREEVGGRFRQLLTSLRGLPADQIIRSVDRWWRDGTKGEASDDVAVLVVRFVS